MIGRSSEGSLKAFAEQNDATEAQTAQLPLRYRVLISRPRQRPAHRRFNESGPYPKNTLLKPFTIHFFYDVIITTDIRNS